MAAGNRTLPKRLLAPDPQLSDRLSQINASTALTSIICAPFPKNTLPPKQKPSEVAEHNGLVIDILRALDPIRRDTYLGKHTRVRVPNTRPVSLAVCPF